MIKNFRLLVILVFIASISIRLLTLNSMGRTWDEDPYVEQGYKYIELFEKGDFNNSYWYKNPDHPLLARYFYGFVEQFEVHKKNNKIIFPYDYTLPRIISVIISSLTIILVMLIGKKYFSIFVGLFSGILLSLLPLFIGYSQLATLESFIIFTFTLTFFLFLNLLENPTLKNQILVGISLGTSLMVKQTNILLIPLLILLNIYWNISFKKTTSYWYLINIFGIGFITFFILWPMPWFNLQYVINFQNNMWLPKNPLPPPELIFGKFEYAPKYYYLLSFLITTPFLILMLFSIGSLRILKERKSIQIIILFWFLFPFIQSLYHFRQHNIRYIIEIYAPLSIISAIGFDYILKKITTNSIEKFIASLLLFSYCLFTTYKASPYYLTYFNELVGGTKNVYEKKLFLLGWWGEGMKEAGNYIDSHAPKHATIGVAISPYKSFPQLRNQKVEKYNPKKKYDYIVVSYFNVLREGFDDSKIKKDYMPVYTVMANGAKLVTIYSR